MSVSARKCAVWVAAFTFVGVTFARAESIQTGLVPPEHKTLQWNDKGRWSLKLDMNEPAGRTMELRDVQAGAFYHLTPSLKVGGAVSFGEEQISPNTPPQAQTQTPRVKLETSFKF